MLHFTAHNPGERDSARVHAVKAHFRKYTLKAQISLWHLVQERDTCSLASRSTFSDTCSPWRCHHCRRQSWSSRCSLQPLFSTNCRFGFGWTGCLVGWFAADSPLPLVPVSPKQRLQVQPEMKPDSLTHSPAHSGNRATGFQFFAAVSSSFPAGSSSRSAAHSLAQVTNTHRQYKKQVKV